LCSGREQTLEAEQRGKITARSEIERLFAVHLLAGALPVTLGLIRIHLAHFFEQILRVRARNIGRARPTAVTLFRPPWHRFDRFLNPLWHREKGTGNRANRNPSGDFLLVLPCPNRVRALASIRTRCQNFWNEIFRCLGGFATRCRRRTGSIATGLSIAR
jgi:hypothetical protein